MPGADRRVDSGGALAQSGGLRLAERKLGVSAEPLNHAALLPVP